MFISGDFNQLQNLLEKAMDAQTLRWNVISNNIANANVPGFKRSDVTFEAQLERAIKSQKFAEPFPAKLTNKKHIPFTQPISIQSVHPKVQLDWTTTMRNDGNGVDIEYETVQAAKTQMRYQLMASLLNRNYRQITMLLR